MDMYQQTNTEAPRLSDLGLTDGERYHFSRAVVPLSQPVLESRSGVACQVNDDDLYRFKQLLVSLNLDRSEPLQEKLLKSLLHAGRAIARLRPKDIRAQARHEADVLDIARDRDQERRITRSGIYDAMVRVRTERHLLSEQSPESPCHALDAASDRLDRDLAWLHERLNELA